LLIVVL